MDTSILEEQRDQPAWMWVSRGWWSGLFQVIGYEKEKKGQESNIFTSTMLGGSRVLTLMSLSEAIRQPLLRDPAADRLRNG